jgi:hypothetical protein
MWDSFGHLEWVPRCLAGFLGDGEYNYAASLVPMKEEEEEEEEEEERDDTEDYIGYLAYLMDKTKEQGNVDELPIMSEVMDEDETMRLAMKIS